MKANLSLYSNTKEIKGGFIPLDQLLNCIKMGTYQDTVLAVRKVRADLLPRLERGEIDKREFKRLLRDKKEQVPCVTMSGQFTTRNEAELVDYSGLICIDFDDIHDVEEARKQLNKDPYTFASFLSVSGAGIAALVKTTSREKHLDAFFGLESYYLKKYGLVIDKSCKDVCRLRFVSYDPDTFVNEASLTFKEYLKKEDIKKREKVINADYIGGSSDFDYVVNQIQSEQIDITGDYQQWRDIGFAIAEEFGESGREAFRIISMQSSLFNERRFDKDYTSFVKSGGVGITIGTFYHYARESGLSIKQPTTDKIIAYAQQAKRSNRTKESAIKAIEEIEGIDRPDTEEIVDKVFKSSKQARTDLTMVERLEVFLKDNYKIKFNEITRVVEVDGEKITDRKRNQIYVDATKMLGDKVTQAKLNSCIDSEICEIYNPIKDYIDDVSKRLGRSKGHIRELVSSLDSSTGDIDFREYFFRKWYVGMIESIYNRSSPLLLVLCGEKQNTGKTQFFRRLLPDRLKEFYAESKLEESKDSDVLMCENLIILDDEFGGKNKRENKKLKEVTSKETFAIRKPYARDFEILKRLAVLAGTSNDSSLLNDPTGNRRIVPFHIDSINHGVYNSVDKERLFVEAYHAWIDGERPDLNREDIEKLNALTDDFESENPERDMIQLYLAKPDEVGYAQFVSTQEIVNYIQNDCGCKLIVHRVGAELKSLGFVKKSKKVNGSPRKVWQVIVRRGAGIVS